MISIRIYLLIFLQRALLALVAFFMLTPSIRVNGLLRIPVVLATSPLLIRVVLQKDILLLLLLLHQLLLEVTLGLLPPLLLSGLLGGSLLVESPTAFKIVG